MRRNRLYLIGMVFVLAVAFILRVWDLHNVPPGIYYDTGRILQRIWRLNEGYGVLLYFQDIAEPFDFLIRAFFHRLTGGVDLYMGQIFTVWIHLLAVAATGLSAKTLYYNHQHREVIAVFAAFTLATMPPAVVLGQHIFRANSLLLTVPLTLTAIIIAFRNNKWLPALLAGVFMGLATSFYTGGLLFPIAMALAILIQIALVGVSWQRIKQLAAMSIGFGIAMLPWVYYFVRIPNWFLRVDDLAGGESPLSDPSLLWTNAQITLSTLFIPNSLHDLRYNTFTLAFINPVFVIIFAIGLVVSLWRWRRNWYIAPIVIALVMMLPNVLSKEPYQPVRMVGVVMGLSLLVGLGLGELHSTRFRRFIGGAGIVILLGTPIFTGYHVWYHFNVQPLITNPHMTSSIAMTYRLGFEDLLVDMVESDSPTYVPLDYLDSDLAVNVLRVQRGFTVRGYENETLPDGRVIMPRNDPSYGFFIRSGIPAQYGLVLPATREIVILPALDLDVATALHDNLITDGDNLTNREGWLLGQQDEIEGDHVFAELSNIVGDVIAVYDDNLELVGIDAPPELTPNTIQPITLYWRLREQRGEDYYSRLQIWNYEDVNYSFERTSPLVGEADFPLNIHFNIYPSVMWEEGEIIADTRLLPIPEALPDGAYRFVLAVYSYPGFVPVDTTAPASEFWGKVGRTSVNLEAFATPVDSPPMTDIQLGDNYYLQDYTLSIPSDELQAGNTLSATLDWYVEAATEQDLIGYLHVLDSTGVLVAQQDIQPYNGQFPTWAFPENFVVTLAYTVTLPEDASGPFTVRTGMYTYPEIESLAVTIGGAPVNDNALVLE